MAPEPPDSGEPPDVDDGGDRDDDAPASGDAPPSDKPELRAKDLIGRSQAELQEVLDPATLAELQSWFARPSAAVVRERGDVPDEVRAKKQERELDPFEKLGLAMGALDQDTSAQDQARQRALAAIEPRMMSLLERHDRDADTILPVRPTIRAVIDETIVPKSVRMLLPSEDDRSPIGLARDLDVPRDIAIALERDNAPQAVLRDLNRPVEEFERRMEPAFPTPPPEDDMTHAIREALRWRPEPLPPRELVPDLHREWLPYLRGSWPELVAAGKASRAAEVAAVDAQMEADAAKGIYYRW